MAKPNRYLKNFTIFIISFLLLIFSTIFACYSINGVDCYTEGFTPLIRRRYNPIMRHARLGFENFSNNTQEHLNRFFRKNELL